MISRMILMKSSDRLWLGVVAAASLTGCGAVNVNQLGTVQRLLPDRDPLVAQAEPFAWDLQFAGGRYTVYPATPGGGQIIFATPDGLRAFWNGQVLFRVEGLPGAVGSLQSGIEGDERWYARDGGPTVRLACTPPRDWRLSENQRGWRVECKGVVDGRKVSATQVAEFDGAGQLRRIEATVIPGLAPLVLQKRYL
jgi:hypothetical protein